MAENGDGIVQVAYLHGDNVTHSWSESMRRMWEFDRELARPMLDPRPLNVRCQSGLLIPQLRNQATRLFLDRTPHEWLMFVDTDMGFEPDAVHQLLALAHPEHAPIMGGLAFAPMVSGWDGANGYRFQLVPTMYKIGHLVENGHSRFCFFGDYPADSVTPVAATGGAFLLIHRRVLEMLRHRHGDSWFETMKDEEGDLVGEDFSFCVRARALGFPIFVHTGVKTTHAKTFYISEHDYRAQGGGLEETYPDLPVFVHLEETYQALRDKAHVHDNMLKFSQDLERYDHILAATRPEVVVETGTLTGASARWFAQRGLDVITVDLRPATFGAHEPITQLVGSSTDPDIVAKIAELVAGRRCMVSLDSDHSARHVRGEIEAYGPMVSPGCYLVIEDTVFGYGREAKVQEGMGGVVGSPLDPVVELMVDNPDWSRDIAIEKLSAVSSNPAGWWLRNG